MASLFEVITSAGIVALMIEVAHLAGFVPIPEVVLLPLHVLALVGLVYILGLTIVDGKEGFPRFRRAFREYWR